MKGVADRTLELMNEYQETVPHKSYRTFQHFLVVKIEELEDDKEALREKIDKLELQIETTNALLRDVY